MGLEWSGNETHQEVRIVKVEEPVHEVAGGRFGGVGKLPVHRGDRGRRDRTEGRRVQVRPVPASWK